MRSILEVGSEQLQDNKNYKTRAGKSETLDPGSFCSFALWYWTKEHDNGNDIIELYFIDIFFAF